MTPQNEQSERTTCLKKTQICFISCDRDSGFRQPPIAADLMHLDSSRASVQADPEIITDKMEKYGLKDGTIR